ncbi:transcriptional regulator, HxlR family [Streptomyces sp. DI166]|uniref:winged helix-turn-helix transcriptional regulator n=1 Tax=Streptomyces sp. DI166 TaxID=1839783 RepID=UPI0007F47673|nr:helix-turn-helix domain-containing protein [Streptomyces sp. DI166]SBT88132.1 transcriptional regulator, HxlR family [Streptomyces sp. DI166]
MSDLLAERDTWSMANCSIARTLEIVGTRTALLIMREAFFGTRRFDDFAKRVGVGEPAAAARLKELTAAGLLERVPYREPGQRTRHAYQLTRKGRDFLPVLVALRQWGDTWAADEQGPAVVVRHKDCGAEVRAALRCGEGHDVADGETYVDEGPGLLRVEPDAS